MAAAVNRSMTNREWLESHGFVKEECDDRIITVWFQVIKSRTKTDEEIMDLQYTLARGAPKRVRVSLALPECDEGKKIVAYLYPGDMKKPAL